MTRPRNSGPQRRPRSTKPRSAPVEELHPVADPPDIASFREWNLSPEVQEVIAEMGIVEPTPIQRLAIQPVLDGRDVIAKAETGTGKTLAFGAPMMSRIESERATILGLVLCPTRELAQQVHHVLSQLGAPRGVRCALVVGGDPMHPQVDELRAGAQVVVGTPGRVLDLMGQRFLSFPWTEFAVLDEADEMLEIGFLDDVKKILDACPEERQTLLFSATFPTELLRLAREHTKNPVEIATSKGVVTVEGIEHAFLKVDEDDRASALKRLIASTGDDDILLVFCDRRVDVERLMRSLERTRWSVKALHGGYDQAARFRVMTAFRAREVKVLVATDVASRGLDITHVTHVVNFSVPREITDYTHRSGRTGRAGRRGSAITLVAPSEARRWNSVRREMTWDVKELEAAWQVGEMGAPVQNGAAPPKPLAEAPDERRSEAREPSARTERGAGGERRPRSSRRTASTEGASRESSTARARDSRGDADARREPDRADPSEARPRAGERGEAPPRARADARADARAHRAHGDRERDAQPPAQDRERSQRSGRGRDARPRAEAPREASRERAREATPEAGSRTAPREGERKPSQRDEERGGAASRAETPRETPPTVERERRPRRRRGGRQDAADTEHARRPERSAPRPEEPPAERSAPEREERGTRPAAERKRAAPRAASSGAPRAAPDRARQEEPEREDRSRKPGGRSKPSSGGFGAGL